MNVDISKSNEKDNDFAKLKILSIKSNLLGFFSDNLMLYCFAEFYLSVDISRYSVRLMREHDVDDPHKCQPNTQMEYEFNQRSRLALFAAPSPKLTG